MKGKIGLVVGLGVGYVLGARAGRERYEQIKTQWLKIWHLDPVQERVTQVKDFARSQAMAIPTALWTGAVKVARAAGGTGTPGQRLDRAVATGKDAAEEVAEAVEDTVEAVQDAVADAATDRKSAGASAPRKKK